MLFAHINMLFLAAAPHFMLAASRSPCDSPSPEDPPCVLPDPATGTKALGVQSLKASSPSGNLTARGATLPAGRMSPFCPFQGSTGAKYERCATSLSWRAAVLMASSPAVGSPVRQLEADRQVGWTHPQSEYVWEMLIVRGVVPFFKFGCMYLDYLVVSSY